MLTNFRHMPKDLSNVAMVQIDLGDQIIVIIIIIIYFFIYLLQLIFHPVAVVLTLVETKKNK